MGTNYYFRRDDNRTRFFLGKNYALARMIENATLQISGPETGRLAARLELASSEEDSGFVIPDWGRSADGCSLYFVALATEIARWSDGRPISLVSEDGFEDWQDDDAWDEDASTAEFSGRATREDATP